MYPMSPRAIYASEEVFADPLCTARMDRMLAAMGRTDVIRVDREQLNTLSLAHGWHEPRHKGEIRNEPPDPIVFTTLKWPSDEEKEELFARYPILGHERWPRGRLVGFLGFSLRGAAQPKPGGTICQRAYELHTMTGCPYMCDYCGSLSEVIVVGLNVEAFMARMDDWLELCPDQTLFKWDNATDTLCFEPEYGATKQLVEYFAAKDGKYLLLYAGKCADVDWMLDLEHRGKTICAFSVSGPTQSRHIEKGSAAMQERIQAMRKLQEAGYLVRVRFAPVVPVRDWRDECRTMIREVFANARPDIISMDTVQRISAHVAHRTMDLSLWDPEFVTAMDAAAVQMQGKYYGPLPHEKRAEVYRFVIDEVRKVSPNTPVGLCLESYEMWQEFGPELGMRADHYLCNCGPECTPGTAMYREFIH